VSSWRAPNVASRHREPDLPASSNDAGPREHGRGPNLRRWGAATPFAPRSRPAATPRGEKAVGNGDLRGGGAVDQGLPAGVLEVAGAAGDRHQHVLGQYPSNLRDGGLGSRRSAAVKRRGDVALAALGPSCPATAMSGSLPSRWGAGRRGRPGLRAGLRHGAVVAAVEAVVVGGVVEGGGWSWPPRWSARW